LADKQTKNSFLADLVYQNYLNSKSNRDVDMAEFEANIDLFDGKRTEKDYEWMSDISTHDYAAIFITEASLWANQYFQSRDFVDPILEGDKPEDAVKCRAAKKCINKSLNDRGIYHFQKYMKARTLNALAGSVHAICYWEKDVEMKDRGEKEIPAVVWIDEMGKESANPTNVRAIRPKKQSITEKIIRKDRFNYDVIDNRNVFYSNNYCYSIQEKDYLIFRSEETYETLKGTEKQNGYFDLDKIKEMAYGQSPSVHETDTSRETYNREDQQNKDPRPIVKYFDKLLFMGKIWAVIKTRDASGYPEKIENGFDEVGNLKENAELIEGIIEEALMGSTRIIIRFQPQFCRTSKGVPYRPVLRGLCYIHPTRDVGVGDGKYSRDLQVSIDDTINMSNDRVHMATFPTLAVKRYVAEDNDSVYFEPEHMMLLDDPEHDIREFRITDNVQGAMAQAAFLTGKLQQLPAVWPTTMGNQPGRKETATAVSTTENRTNLRSNYKSLTFEFTYNLDFYWMIQQMIFQFAEPETAMLLMGDDAQHFDPDSDYVYQPVSSNIEMEANKSKKVGTWQQILNSIIGMKSPATPPIIAYIIGKMCELQGAEYRQVQKMLEALAKAPVDQGGEKGADAKDDPMQNQFGGEMSTAEMGVRPGM
jgi:hypothetical protein